MTDAPYLPIGNLRFEGNAIYLYFRVDHDFPIPSHMPDLSRLELLGNNIARLYFKLEP